MEKCLFTIYLQINQGNKLVPGEIWKIYFCTPPLGKNREKNHQILPLFSLYKTQDPQKLHWSYLRNIVESWYSVKSIETQQWILPNKLDLFVFLHQPPSPPIASRLRLLATQEYLVTLKVSAGMIRIRHICYSMELITQIFQWPLILILYYFLFFSVPIWIKDSSPASTELTSFVIVLRHPKM